MWASRCTSLIFKNLSYSNFSTDFNKFDVTFDFNDYEIIIDIPTKEDKYDR